MNHCPYCEAACPDDADVCPACGRRFPDAPEVPSPEAEERPGFLRTLLIIVGVLAAIAIGGAALIGIIVLLCMEKPLWNAVGLTIILLVLNATVYFLMYKNERKRPLFWKCLAVSLFVYGIMMYSTFFT